ncbi:MAG: DNA polymerase I [Coriobacteriales bacterium]|jgi:DNA polymerase-1|nr:DNA polymerase I [Coriobacteriales bacterium]
MKTIAVIDGNSLMHRAFHAVPSYMTAPDGSPTNACFGFISMLLKLADEFTPDAIVCAFDQGIPAFRFEAIERYKAQRPPTDPDLKVQFPIIKKLLESLNIPVISLQDWEGDDILGTVATQAERDGLHALLVTGDKDALQLASATTQIVNTKTGMSDVVVYGPEEVYERWGVTPERVPDFLGLMGDSSDNIPGVPGVGPKTATKLLQEYGTLEEVVAHASDIKGKLGENVRHNAELAYASKRVATIRRDVPLALDLAATAFPSFDAQTVTAAFGEFAMTSQLRKLLALAGGYAAPALASVAESFSFAQALKGAKAHDLLGTALAQGLPLAVSLEDAGGSSLFETARQLFVASEQGTAQFDEQELQQILVRILREGTLVALDTKALLRELIPANSALPQALPITEVDPARLFDLQVAAYLLDSSKNYADLALLALKYLPGANPDAVAEEQRGACNVALILKLKDILHEALQADESLVCFETIELPLLPVLVQMERLGVNVNNAVLGDLDATMTRTIEQLRAQAYELAGEEFNLDSPKQLGVVLFEKLKLPTGKKTRSGYSTDASVLTELAVGHALPRVMLEYRELAKLKSTYLDALPRLLASDHHIHTSFNQTVAATGRLSSSDPNLQNIPVRTDLGRQIRTAFIPDAAALGASEAVFLSADYSQIELRLLAHLSGDEGLIEAFLGGEDFHASTAARVFDLPLDQVSPQLRSRAKAVNFGIVYGQQAFGLSQSLGLPFDEAQDMIDRYFAAYPQVRAYLDATVRQAHENGWVETLFGRKRHINELRSSNANLRAFGERTAMNHPMQGSAADIIKLAMIEVQRRLNTGGFQSQMILQVHDELDFNCASGEIERLSAMVKEAMEKVAHLKVPLTVTVSTGSNWAEAH